MGLRFRKSVKVASGVRINLGKKSASITVGDKGFHHTVSSTGKKITSLSAPGTGLSYSSTRGKKPNDSKNSASTGQTSQTKTMQNKMDSNQSKTLSDKLLKKYSLRTIKIFRIVFLVLGIIFALFSIVSFTISVSAGVICVIPTILALCIAHSYKKVIRFCEKG